MFTSPRFINLSYWINPQTGDIVRYLQNERTREVLRASYNASTKEWSHTTSSTQAMLQEVDHLELRGWNSDIPF